MNSPFDRTSLGGCLAPAERGATSGERATSLVVCGSQTASWHSASGNWICEKHRAFADEVAVSLIEDEDGFVDIVPEPPTAKIEDPDDFDDDIPDLATLRASR